MCVIGRTVAITSAFFYFFMIWRTVCILSILWCTLVFIFFIIWCISFSSYVTVFYFRDYMVPCVLVSLLKKRKNQRLMLIFHMVPFS